MLSSRSFPCNTAEIKKVASWVRETRIQGSALPHSEALDLGYPFSEGTSSIDDQRFWCHPKGAAMREVGSLLFIN